MQEQVARSIVYELQLAFNPSGVVMPPEAVSAVPEASSLGEMGSAVPMNSAASIRVAISYYLKAVQLDTGYAFAYLNIARSYGNIYPYDHSDSILSLADSFFAIGKRFDTAGVFYHFVASWLATQHRDFETAIREAKIYLQKRPQDARGYRVLGLAYHAEGKLDLAVLNFEEDLKRNPLNMGEMGTIYDDLYRSGDTASLKRFATQVLPLFESAVMRNPENRELESRYIWMLFASGRGDEAGRRMDNFIKPPFDNPNGMEDAVELFAMNKNTVHAMELLRDVVKRINIADTNSWNLNEKELVNLRPLPEFQELLKHQKEAVAKKNGL
jgi:tetratricopeptide (TPR) repeat protein